MRDALPSYRPHFRPGFQEDFLFEQRHEPEGGRFSLQQSAPARASGFLAKVAAFLFPAFDAVVKQTLRPFGRKGTRSRARSFCSLDFRRR
jgi:hypothetical protein